MPRLRPWLLAIAAVVAGCSSVKIRTEYDTSASFSAYRTYSWISGAPGPEQAPAVRNPQVRALVVEAVDREMGKKGLVRAPEGATPDFLVAVLGWAQSRVEVTNYGYTYGAAYAYGPYYTSAVVVPVSDVREYTEGTLLLDFVDARTKKLVWRGTATDTLGSPETVRATIDEAVRKLLAAYPPR